MAANTDKFKKGARKWVGQIGAAGVADASVTTIPLTSATGLPTDTAIVAVIDRVDSSGTKTPSLEESVVGVVSGSNLVTCTRGAEGTAQAHLAGAVVEILVTNIGWNDMIDGILAEHSQAGAHTAASDTAAGVVELATTAETTTGTDATRAVTPDGLHDMTSLAGAAWFLDEDNMASDSATKVPSQQSVKAYVDTTAVTASSTTTFTNKTIDATGTGNSITNLAASNISNRTRYKWLTTGDFNAGASGTPVLGSSNGGNAYAWLLDAGATEDIWAVAGLPADIVTGNVTLDLFWSMESSNSGNVVLQAQVSNLRDGTAIDSITTLLSHQQTVAVPTGAADTVKMTTFNTFTGTAGDALRIRILRLGGDGSDNATGDLCAYAVRLSYTADM